MLWHGLVSKMVLSADTTSVVVSGQYVRVRRLVASVKDALICTSVPASYPVVYVVLAGQTASKVGGSTGRTHRGVAEGLVELEPFLGQLVNVGSVDLWVAIRSIYKWE